VLALRRRRKRVPMTRAPRPALRPRQASGTQAALTSFARAAGPVAGSGCLDRRPDHFDVVACGEPVAELDRLVV
jgi:hypothetical protein